MKKIIAVIFLLIFASSNLAYADNLNITAESAILIDAETGQVLYEKNPHLKLHPASTTKIMTGILAIELGNPNDIVTIDDEIASTAKGSHIALESGEQLLFKDLLYALLVESANDSACAIAKHISGSIEEFVKLMNNKAKELGALDTHFVNPNGLTDENHLTTAYDLSLMARYAMKNQTFREIVSNYTYTIPPTNKKNEERHLWSSNKLLFSTNKINVDGKIVPIKYEGITGVKTGYTTEAGNCLVASAERGNKSLIAVALKSNGQEVFSDIHKLLNYGFEKFDKVNIATKDQFIDNFEIQDGTIPVVAGIIKDNLTVSIPTGSIDKVSEKVIVNEDIKAPIKKGQVLGKVEYYLQDKLLGSVNIVSTMDIEEIPKPTIFKQIIDKWYLILIAGFIIIRVIALTNKRKRKRAKRALYKFPS